MHNLVIDIGNTNSKLAIFSEKELVHYQRVSGIEQSALSNLIEQYQVANAAVSSVKDDIHQLGSFLAEKVNYVPFTTALDAGIINRYETPSTLGLDRWAKVIAASRLFPNRNCMMIDAGTCITYDTINDKKEYFGGSISMGIKMRFESLNHYTGRLPLINWGEDEKNIPFGSNTRNAIKNGVLQGVMHEIEGFVTEENQKNKELIVIITGGDADFLNKQLKNSIFATQIIYEPYLVLKGINEVIT